MSVARRHVLAAPIALALPAFGATAPAQAATAPAATAVDAARLDPSIGAALAGQLLFGAAVTPTQLKSPAVANFIRHHFRVLVAENAMKPESLSPAAEGQYAFGPADDLVNFGLANGMRVRGHTLVWHWQTAPWMFQERGREVSRTRLIERLERYIADVVGHFKGRVFAWDVVNEAYVFDEPGVAVDANHLRMSDWRRIIGPEYIEIAFRAAARADPDALLFYNDYETQRPEKVAAISAMVKDFKARGVKIDGVGHQMHSALRWPHAKDVAAAIDTIALTGVAQHVTEMDIALNDKLTGTSVTAATPELLAAQAQRYRELMTVFVARRDKVSAVLVWGVSDADSWLTTWPTKRFEAPLLFDDRMQAKPAYFAVMDVAAR